MIVTDHGIGGKLRVHGSDLLRPHCLWFSSHNRPLTELGSASEDVDGLRRGRC